jgi:hypothetical protein
MEKKAHHNDEKEKDNDEKEKEKWFLEGFFKYINISPTSIAERQKPDFLVTIGKKEFGIEVTHFSANQGEDNNSEQRQEVFREKISSIIKQQMNESKIVHRRIEVSFGNINISNDKVVKYLISLLPNDSNYKGYVDINKGEDKRNIFNSIRIEPAEKERCGLFYSQSYDL